MRIKDRVAIHWVELQRGMHFFPGEKTLLVSLIMSYFSREVFVAELERMGYCPGEGRLGSVDDKGLLGTILPIYRLKFGKKTGELVADLYTSRHITEDNE